MKSLFSEEALNYTPEGVQLDHEIHRAIDKIIKWWVQAGYNIREIGLIAMMAANDITLEELLRMQFEISKKRTAESKARMMAKLNNTDSNIDAGWTSGLSRVSHKHQIRGSNPLPAKIRLDSANKKFYPLHRSKSPTC